jgi:hypothetical protein
MDRPGNAVSDDMKEESTLRERKLESHRVVRCCQSDIFLSVAQGLDPLPHDLLFVSFILHRHFGIHLHNFLFAIVEHVRWSEWNSRSRRSKRSTASLRSKR